MIAISALEFHDYCLLCGCLHYPTLIPLGRKIENRDLAVKKILHFEPRRGADVSPIAPRGQLFSVNVFLMWSTRVVLPATGDLVLQVCKSQKSIVVVVIIIIIIIVVVIIIIITTTTTIIISSSRSTHGGDNE